MSLVSPARLRPNDRVQTESNKAPSTRPVQMQAPVRGWIETDSLAEPTTGGARLLENAFPTQTGVRVRGGCDKHATVGAKVISMFSYKSATTNIMFAATETDVYDVSAAAPSTVPAASIASQTSGYYCTAPMETAAGNYLYAVNGTDKPQLFDGTTWTAIDGVSTPAITGVTTTLLENVWVHKNRFWFVEKDSNTAWYLPVDSIGGAAADLSLAGVFQDGGKLLFITTWSSDSGSGMDDRAVFVSDQGEVAVYQGTDPASASTWALVGVYRMAPPLGRRAFIRAGGDVLIATSVGLVAVSSVVTKDPAALELTAVSRPISISWNAQAKGWLSSTHWAVAKWPRESMVVVSTPSDTTQAFVANLNTGAWCRYTGWDIQAMTLHNDRLYFGDSSGDIFDAEAAGADNTAPYTAKISPHQVDFGSSGTFKQASVVRANFISAVDFNPQISASVNYNLTFPAAPSAASVTSSAALWDVGLWDTATWDADLTSYENRPFVTTGWVPVDARGFVMTPQVQITSGSTVKPDAELISFEMMLAGGGSVV